LPAKPSGLVAKATCEMVAWHLPDLPPLKGRNRGSRKNGSFFQDLLINADAQTKLVCLRILTVLSVILEFAFLSFLLILSFFLALFSGDSSHEQKTQPSQTQCVRILAATSA
jgi:hypothetical protein